MDDKVAIVGIFVVFMFAFVIADSQLTGYLAQNGYYGNKVYGGAIKKIPQNPQWNGRVYAEQVRNERAQYYMYGNRDKWDCSFSQQSADDSIYPCVFDDVSQKYCCIVDDSNPYWAVS